MCHRVVWGICLVFLLPTGCTLLERLPSQRAAIKGDFWDAVWPAELTGKYVDMLSPRSIVEVGPNDGCLTGRCCTKGLTLDGIDRTEQEMVEVLRLFHADVNSLARSFGAEVGETAWSTHEGGRVHRFFFAHGGKGDPKENRFLRITGEVRECEDHSGWVLVCEVVYLW